VVGNIAPLFVAVQESAVGKEKPIASLILHIFRFVMTSIFVVACSNKQAAPDKASHTKIFSNQPLPGHIPNDRVQMLTQ